MSAPISVAPSISKPATLNPPAAVANVPAKVAFAPLKVKAVVPEELDLITNCVPEFVSVPNNVPPSFKKISAPSASKTISVPASIVATAEEEIVKSVPSPSIFSPSSPNTNPTLFGKFTSAVAVNAISAPEVIVKSVLSPSIFSPVPKVIQRLLE